MRRTSIFAIALAILLLGAAAALAGNTWNGYHWADGTGDEHGGSISLTLVDHLGPYEGVYTEVLDDWKDSKGPLSLASNDDPKSRPAACDDDDSKDAGDEIFGEIHVCNYAYGTNGWLGLARIWLADDGHIDAGVALMNDSYLLGTNSPYNDPNAWQHVLCQEIGHTFGLDHQKSRKQQSCMNDRWGLTSLNFVGPNSHDYDTLNAIYGLASSDDGDGGATKPCNPRRKNCPTPGANVHVAPRPGGGWIITYTIPPGRGLG